MDVRDLVDPAYREVLTAMAAAPAPDWSNPAAVRDRNRAAFPPAPIPEGVDHKDHAAPGANGAPDITVRVYGPASQSGPLPCIYWIHGGGYMGGSYDGNNDLASAWVRDLNCVVASVEYRLAPECPYPGPLDDCYAGLAWLTKNAGSLQVDPARVLIAGGSAGAGLAAALALLVRDRAEIAITHQILIYPMIDDRRTTASSQWDTWVWTKNSNEIGWRSYLGPLFGKDDVPAYAAPSRATDLSKLPATFMMVGTLDLFLDEDLEYAQRLIHAGVPVELHVYPGAPHGFDVPRFGGKSQLAARARRELKEYLHTALTG